MPEKCSYTDPQMKSEPSPKGGYIALAVKISIPPSTLYHAARPGSRPSPGLAIRLAAVVAPIVIGVTAA